MAAIISVTTSRVRDGKTQEFLARLGELKGHVKRLGGTLRVLQQVYGATPLTITSVIEFASWAEFGAFSEKLGTDTGYQGFLAKMRDNPVSEIVARGVSTELAV